MSEFVEVAATSHSFSRRKPVHGVGINDAWYVTHQEIDGVRSRCPFYVQWANMFVRCYCEKSIARSPTYKGCSVSDEWRVFSVFRKWMETQDWKGKQLDKDLLVSGNKVYSSSTCMFVSPAINCLLSSSEAIRGEFPQGVTFDKSRGAIFVKVQG